MGFTNRRTIKDLYFHFRPMVMLLVGIPNISEANILLHVSTSKLPYLTLQSVLGHLGLSRFF